MRPNQPLTELAGGLVRRRTVEGHQGRRAAGHTDDLCAPAIDADRRHLDEVIAAVDGFFEAMVGHDGAGGLMLQRTPTATSEILATSLRGSSEITDEDTIHT